MRELAVSADQLFDDLSLPAPRRQGPAAGRRPRLLRGAPEPAVQLGALRHARRRRTPASATSTGKIFLPTYGVFDEERFVEAGRGVQAFDTRWGRAAILICEDAWHSFTPMLAALDGAQLIIIPSASPARGVVSTEDAARAAGEPRRGGAGSRRTWPASTASTSRSPSWSGSRAARRFPAGAWWRPRGATCWPKAPVFEEAVLQTTLDFEEITRARADLPLLADLEMRLPHLLGSLHDARRGGRPGGRAAAGAPARREAAPARPATRRGPRPALAAPRHARQPDRDPLAIDPELTRRWLVEFIRDEVQRRRGFERVVIGLSGGVDSSLVAYLAAEAVGRRQRDRGPDAVPDLEPREPGPRPARDRRARHSAPRRWTSAPRWTVSPRPSASRPAPGRLGNIMARTRMITLFDLSAAQRALPLGTGNKTERLFGYFTWHADDSPPVNPDRRPVQDPGLGAGPAPRRARRDRLQARERRPDQGPDRRGRLRHQLSAGRRDPPLDPARATGPGDRRAGLHRGRRSSWSASASTPPTGSGGSRRSRC